jgi:hypothetical protein
MQQSKAKTPKIKIKKTKKKSKRAKMRQRKSKRMKTNPDGRSRYSQALRPSIIGKNRNIWTACSSK